MVLKQKNLISIVILGTFLASCAPPFEAQDAKRSSQNNVTAQGKNEAERTTFEVPPAISPELIRQLPAEEQRVGTGANTVQLGQLEITESRIHRLEDGKRLRFTGKGKLRDQRFDIDLSGQVDNEGKARMFPADSSSTRTNLNVRGMGVCLDLVGTRFYCRSLFVEVYVRVGTETFSEQFVLRNASQNGGEATPQRGSEVAPERAGQPQQQGPTRNSREGKVTRDGGQKGAEGSSAAEEQEAPRGLTPEQQAAETDIEHEGEQQAESGAEENGGRFVGFRDEVDSLFRSQDEQAPPAPLTTQDPTDKPAPLNNHSGSPTEKPRSLPQQTAPAAPSASAIPSAPTAATTAEEAAGVPLETVTDPEATATAGAETTVDANVQQVSGGFVLQVAPKPQRPTTPQRPQQQAQPQQRPQQPAAQAQPPLPVAHQPSPHPAAALGGIADQARGCYNAGLGASCRSGGNLRNATQLPQSGPGFRVLYPQRQMNFGTRLLVDLIVDLGRKIDQMLPGYQLPVSDMSSQFGGRYGARRDGGHQNGLEADLAYITTTSPPPLVVVVTGSFRREIMKMDEQLNAWKHVVKSGKVSRIFVDRQVKAAFCQYTNRMTQEPDLQETLRRLQHWEGHRNHWHLRLKCPASSPRCQDDSPLANRTGC